jgi:hypothetical protein
MAETIIRVEYRPERIKKITVPERIRVKRGDGVRWMLNIFQPNLPLPERLLFELYFPKGSAFAWSRQFLTIDLINPPFFPSSNLLLADGVTSKPGDFKYGVRAIDQRKQEPIEDVDPFLIVY